MASPSLENGNVKYHQLAYASIYAKLLMGQTPLFISGKITDQAELKFLDGRLHEIEQRLKKKTNGKS